MPAIDSKTLDLLWHDPDSREMALRRVVEERLAETPPPRSDDHVVATYFFAFRTESLGDAVKEIAYHATSGIKDPPPGSLLAECTATAAGVDPFDSTGRIGLLNIAFPLKMMLQGDGHLTSVDLLHTTAAAIIFDVYENQDARLVSLQIPDKVLATFPGPAHGPFGLRKLTGFDDGRPAFGTILKPTAGVTPDDIDRIVGEVAGCDLLMFIKEDEDLYPNLPYSPVADRMKRAAAAIERIKDQRGGLGLVYAPHVTGAPNEILETVLAVLEAGANGVMFSETFTGGAVRMVREATRHLSHPPAIYGHNAGIGTRTRAIWREVIDLLARLDGIDFRQTAPVKPGTPFLRPYGAEWLASEVALSRPLPGGLNPTMIARAGALDQGNVILNLQDAEQRGLTDHILFLAGSAINSIKDDSGKYEPRLGAEAMREALEVHRSGSMAGVPMEKHLDELVALADRQKLVALRRALRQRYPDRAG
jgi:ribulose 1,5-bisphosphate carboxylase large subunit-like protein